MKDNKIKITRIHIGSLDKDENKFYRFNMKEYPDRLCVVDYEKEIVVDVETRHQYPYIETKSMLYLTNSIQLKKLKLGQRVGCVEYLIIPSLELDSQTIKECEEIILLLEKGYTFPDGNVELTNEEYLEMVNKQKENVNQSKEQPKTKKISKKRK